ncbi:MAG TPA: ABC transporter permease [Gammaproteobacteria bacterium]|nr:ABC transporter permease [Gammaproteobacteria bacterium]
MRALFADARYALRSLRQRPAITAVAVATLAIGAGAATATFAVVNSVLLEPLSYPRADELVAIWHDAPGAEFPLEDGGLLASASMFFTYTDENRVFENVGLWTPGVATITGDGEPEEVPRVAVTAGVLEALGVPPLLGRWFGSDELAAGAGRTIILSYGYWQRRFGGDRGVIGRTLTVNAQPAEIIGVMPRGFRIADRDADLLMGPMRFDRASLMLPPFAYYGIARLRPGTTVADANADIARMLPIWLESWPPQPGGAARAYVDDWQIRPSVRPLKQDVVGGIGEVLWLVMAALGVVLAIASANVANLMLIRAAARRHELAIRAALGAGAGRLRRALRLEGLAIGLLSGLVGVVIGEAGLRLLVAANPANVPRLAEVGLDAEVIAAAFAVTSLAGFIVGLVAAARVRDAQLNEGLHVGGRTSSGGREQHRIQQSLVVAQVALAVVVLVCAGLAIRTVGALRAVDPGFAGAEHVQTLRISMRDNQVAEPERVATRHREILDALATLPGVTAVALASSMPMDQFNLQGDTVEVEGGPANGRAPEPSVRRFKYVSPGLFDAVGTALVAGRDLSWSDLNEYRPVVLVSENMARELWSDPAAAIGKRLRVPGEAGWREIIGVAADVREDGLREPAPTIVYWPSFMRERQPLRPELGEIVVVSRSVIVAVRGPLAGSEGFPRQVQEAVWSVDPNLPITSVRTLADIYDESLERTTLTLVALVGAAGAALMLGVVGLYGVLSYAFSLRRREIAVRLALGAEQSAVRRGVVRQGVALAAVGIVIGVIAAAAVTRLMTSLLYGVDPVDPLTYAAVAAGLMAVAALASYMPAQRASAVDPAESLAAE